MRRQGITGLITRGARVVSDGVGRDAPSERCGVVRIQLVRALLVACPVGRCCGCALVSGLGGAAPFVAPLQPPTKIVYLVAATVAPTVPASFLKRTETAFYPSYATAPRVWGFRRSSTFRLLGS